ncbi:hypothetical protein I7I51_04486 [Histoplasma capsulatum]|uniref:Uncharacterized protein n=1 Tax=Ajellomyces capsulatus TaxID=5037 RepID=A0A8A1M733_AJECA|nr:predicted protein [Histoplasma mississippiense (nom. inval.)]EDN07602.1 predicted protein [Histoplasma mississippiense (nom. inval.)]QSS62308.1 hypothetical protein I7I51_04486 [Histoplasma capsulatum]
MFISSCAERTETQLSAVPLRFGGLFILANGSLQPPVTSNSIKNHRYRIISTATTLPLFVFQRLCSRNRSSRYIALICAEPGPIFISAGGAGVSVSQCRNARGCQ